MANAFFLRPLPIAAASGSTTRGLPMNVANDHMGLVWGAVAQSLFEHLMLDMGPGNKPIDTLMIFGVGWAGAALPGACTILLGKDGDPGFAGAGAEQHAFAIHAGAELPSSGRGVSLWTRPGGAGAFRYVQLRFAGFGAAFDQLWFSRVVLGQRVQLERNFAFGAAFGVRDLGRTEFSASGTLLRRRANKLRTLGLSFPHVRRDEVEAKVQPLIEQAGGQEPLAFCLDPDPHPQRMKRCYFGPLLGDLGTIWTRANGFEWRANLIDLVPIPEAS
jgi:hypothetical protein